MGPQDPFSKVDKVQAHDSPELILSTRVPLVAAITGVVLGGALGTAVVFDAFWPTMGVLLTSVLCGACFFVVAKIFLGGKWKEALRVLMSDLN